MVDLSPVIDWSPYLDPGEQLLWAAQPSRGAMLRWTAFIFAIFAVFSLPFSWFALIPNDIVDACGSTPSRSCRKLYAFAQPGFALLAGTAFLYLLQFLLRVGGLIRTHYAVTDQYSMTLWDGPYTKLWKVKLTSFDAFYREFHSTVLLSDRRRPTMTFIGVEYENYWELEQELYKMRTGAK